MKFSVSNEAAKWLIEELDLETGSYVEIYSKIYGGIPTVYPDYYLGITVEDEIENDPTYKVVIDDVTFCIQDGHDWLLNEYHLSLELIDDEVEYLFTK